MYTRTIAETAAKLRTSLEKGLTAEQAAARCRDQAEQAATHDMIAGVILSEQQSIVCSGGVYRRTSALSCREMIARMTAASIRMR